MSSFFVIFLGGMIIAFVWYHTGFAYGYKRGCEQTVPYRWSCPQCHFHVNTNHQDLTIKMADDHERRFH